MAYKKSRYCIFHATLEIKKRGANIIVKSKEHKEIQKPTPGKMFHRTDKQIKEDALGRMHFLCRLICQHGPLTHRDALAHFREARFEGYSSWGSSDVTNIISNCLRREYIFTNERKFLPRKKPAPLYEITDKGKQFAERSNYLDEIRIR